MNTPRTTGLGEPETWTLSKPLTRHDWPDTGENANYMNVCDICGVQFIGHKRRHVCRKCFTTARLLKDVVPM